MDELKIKSTERDTLTKTVTIPLAEYLELVRSDALLDVILHDTDYNHQNVVGAVGRAIEANVTAGGAEND